MGAEKSNVTDGQTGAATHAQGANPDASSTAAATASKDLYLAVDSKTAAAWTLRYQLGGRGHWMGLGSARDFTLEQARQRAKEWRQKKADGIDPIQTKRAERQAKLAAAAATKTFKQCAQDLIEARRERVAQRQARAGMAAARCSVIVYPIIGGLDVAQIDRPAVLRVLEQRVPASRGDQPGKFWNITHGDRRPRAQPHRIGFELRGSTRLSPAR